MLLAEGTIIAGRFRLVRELGRCTKGDASCNTTCRQLYPNGGAAGYDALATCISCGVCVQQCGHCPTK